MYQKLREDLELWGLLLKIEKDLARTCQEKGCRCGGTLHRAGYERKPRGGPSGLGREYEWRHSFCCAEEGCRRRATPPSVLFLGRRVYFSLVLVLVTALRQGPTPQSRIQLRAWVGVDSRTLRRWQRWWQETFPELPFWRGVRGSGWSTLRREDFPLALWQSFGGESLGQRMMQLLRFLLPLTEQAI